MKVSFTPQIKMANNAVEKQPAAAENLTEYKNNTAYNPIAYRDYNISFGDRLFRSPENFYEQDFNRDNMPKTLYEYIYTGENTELKKTIPPAQAMGIVFKKIEDADNLDDVKAKFPDEPLFKDLSSTPKVKSREGLLGVINLLKDDPEYIENNRTLFKNGKNDLGMYILKKIYLEGKTLKEINEDFKKDVSVYYQGFDIQAKDYQAFGIKFPKHSFWHSFTYNRESFPYVRIPRELTEKPEGGTAGSANPSGKPTERPRKPKFTNVNDWEIGKITDTVTNSGGNKTKIRSQLSKDKSEATSFVAKYMSEIMSVTMERLHMSPEMKAFFNNYENIDENQRTKLKKYWESPKLREDMSYVMKSTIQMFMEAYDEDGENEYFKDLIDYAHSIKPEREAAEAAHEAKQIDYEQIFADPENVTKLDEIMAKLEPKQSQESEQVQEATELTEDVLYEQAARNGAKVYKLMLPDDAAIYLTYNRAEMANDLVEGSFGPFPKELKSKLYSYVLNSEKVPDEYLLAVQINNTGLNKFIPEAMLQAIKDEKLKAYFEDELRERIMPQEEMKKIARAIGIEFEAKNRNLIDMSREVMLELISGFTFDNKYRTNVLMQHADRLDQMSEVESLQESFRILDKVEIARRDLNSPAIGVYTLSELANVLHNAGIRKLSPEEENFVNSRMEFYRQPLSNKELKQLSNSIPQQLMDLNIRKSDFVKDKMSTFIWDSLMKNIKNHPELKRAFIAEFKEAFMKPEKSWFRSFLDDSVNENVKKLNLQTIIVYFFQNKKDFLKKVMAYDLDGVDNYLKYHQPEFYRVLEYEHQELLRTHEFDKYKK